MQLSGIIYVQIDLGMIYLN